jgi:hypothetical protein
MKARFLHLANLTSRDISSVARSLAALHHETPSQTKKSLPVVLEFVFRS